MPASTGLTRVEATASGVASWTDHVKALGVGLLSNEVNSWMTGINSNVEGKQTRIVARYSGSAPAYRARCDEVAAKAYAELELGLTRAAHMPPWSRSFRQCKRRRTSPITHGTAA